MGQVARSHLHSDGQLLSPRLAIAVVCAIVFTPVAASVRQGAASNSIREFEAVSIRESEGEHGGIIFQQPGRLTITNLPLSTIVEYAFDLKVRGDQLIDVPDWSRTTRFTINAVYEGPQATHSEERAMLRAMLEKRFALVARRDTRGGRIHLLRVARSDRRLGPRLAAVDDHCERWRAEKETAFRDAKPVPRLPAAANRGTCQEIANLGRLITGSAVSMKELASALESSVQTPVLDDTHLEGLFDVDLTFTPLAEISNPSSGGVSIYTALQEQLGLKLEVGQGPLEVLVIQAMKYPTPN